MSDNFAITWDNHSLFRRKENSSNKQVFDENNKVVISGIIEKEFEFSHQTYQTSGRKFYKTRVITKRLSGKPDFIPIIVPDNLLSDFPYDSFEGEYAEICGKFCSYNKLGEDGKIHLELFVFTTAIDIYKITEAFDDIPNENLIYLDCRICKPPIYRMTSLSKIKITELLVAVNRDSGKSDYIPCIAWNNVALYAKDFEVNDRIILHGRVQSREYFKRYSHDSTDGEYRMAYEISIMKLLKIQNSDK